VNRRVRRFALLLTAFAALAVGAAAALAVPAVHKADVPPSTGTFTAVDYDWEGNGGSSNMITIAPGGTVTFGYPSGTDEHNVDFDSGSSPTSCTQSAGTNTGAVPPLPSAPQAKGWSGSCTFNTPGTYSFHCDKHLDMRGTIFVDPGTTTGSGTTPTGTSPGGSTGGGGSTTTPGTKISPARPSVSVPHHQHGTALKGSVSTPAGPSKIAITAFVSKKLLAAKPVKVGWFSKRSTGTGKTSFTLKLNSTAKRALKRRHSLAISLRILVTPSGGSAVTKTAAVTLRG
jgi:plastocyanin